MSKSEQKDKQKKTLTLPKNSAKVLGYGVILIFLLAWVFVLGVLTGRGDIHRWLERLGVHKTELASRLGITSAQPETPVLPALPVVDSGKPQAEPAVAAVPTAESGSKPTEKSQAAAPAAPDGEAAKKAGEPARPDAKKGKGSPAAKVDPKGGIASKLSFQNSLDSQARKPHKTTAKKDAEKKPHQANVLHPGAEPATKTAPAYRVTVASYRTAAEAQKTMADLSKKGVKVTLQQTKDQSGPKYVIHTQRYQSRAEADKVAKKLREANLGGQVQELKP